MKLSKIVISMFILSIVSINALAATVICSGTVDTLAYHGNNKLMIKLSSMNTPVFFCSPESEWAPSGTTYKTGPETCKTLYSTFLAAKMSGKTITSMYFDGDQVPATCGAWEAWKQANIRYFSL